MTSTFFFFSNNLAKKQTNKQTMGEHPPTTFFLDFIFIKLQNVFYGFIHIDYSYNATKEEIPYNYKWSQITTTKTEQVLGFVSF